MQSGSAKTFIMWPLLLGLCCGAAGLLVGILFPPILNPSGNTFPASLIYGTLFTPIGSMLGLIIGAIIATRKTKHAFGKRPIAFALFGVLLACLAGCVHPMLVNPALIGFDLIFPAILFSLLYSPLGFIGGLIIGVIVSKRAGAELGA